jgi:hypothetical protein
MSKIPKKEMILWMIGGFVILFVAIFIPFLLVGLNVGGNFEYDFDAQVDSSMVNGILTADAVIFGFITIELRRITNRIKLASFVLAFPIIIVLIGTVGAYFVDGVTLGYATVNTLIWATITFFYIILHFVYFATMLKVYNIETD